MPRKYPLVNGVFFSPVVSYSLSHFRFLGCISEECTIYLRRMVWCCCLFNVLVNKTDVFSSVFPELDGFHFFCRDKSIRRRCHCGGAISPAGHKSCFHPKHFFGKHQSLFETEHSQNGLVTIRILTIYCLLYNIDIPSTAHTSLRWGQIRAFQDHFLPIFPMLTSLFTMFLPFSYHVPQLQ